MDALFWKGEKIRMHKTVAGHLRIKEGVYFIILSYTDHNGKKVTRAFSTSLKEKGNKRKAEALLAKVRAEYIIPRRTRN